MTFFEWVRECLRQEAIRTAPDGRNMIQAVIREMDNWNQRE